MKKSELLDLAIKILGLYLMVKTITILKDIHYIVALYQDGFSNVSNILVIVLYMLAIAAMVVGAIYLIFMSRRITAIIIKSSDADLQVINLGFEKGLELALIIFGLIIVIFKFPHLINALYNMALHFIDRYGEQYDFFNNSVVHILQYILGVLLIIKPKAIGLWILRGTDLEHAN